MSLSEEETDARFIHFLIKEALTVEEPNDDDLLNMLHHRDKRRDRRRARSFLFDVLTQIGKKQYKLKLVKQPRKYDRRRPWLLRRRRPLRGEAAEEIRMWEGEG